MDAVFNSFFCVDYIDVYATAHLQSRKYKTNLYNLLKKEKQKYPTLIN